MVNTSFPKPEERKSSEKLSPGQVFGLVLTEKKIGPAAEDLLDADEKGAKPEIEVLQAGQTVAEPVAEVPEVVVEGNQVVEPITTAAEVREEIAAGVPPKVAETDEQIKEVVETAVPPVAAEEKAAEVQESATDTAPAKAAQKHDGFIKGPEDADTGQAEELEKTIAYSPETGDMEEQ